MFEGFAAWFTPERILALGGIGSTIGAVITVIYSRRKVKAEWAEKLVGSAVSYSESIRTDLEQERARRREAVDQLAKNVILLAGKQSEIDERVGELMDCRGKLDAVLAILNREGIKFRSKDFPDRRELKQ